LRVKFNASILLLALIVILLAAGIFFAVSSLRTNPVEDALSTDRVINTLFVIEDEKKPVSTYILMYYPATRRAAVFDIPGELGLLITRINRVDRIDRVYDSLKISSYENEIEKLLGIDISFSIIITKENLVSLVDFLEGVRIFIPSPVFQKDDSGLIMFPSGTTVLDGDKAGVYASYSLPDEDREMEMFRRQRFFLGLLDRWVLVNDKLINPQAAKIYYSFFRTGMSRSTLIRLFDEFAHIDTGRVNIQSVWGNLREVSGQNLIIPHWEGNLIKEVVRQTLGTLTRQIEDPFNERSITVEVLNGTAITGLAGRTAEVLRSFGYDVISISNADRNNYERTVIIHRSEDENMVKAFADVIRCTNIRRERSENEQDAGQARDDFDFKAELTLIIGRNFNGRYVTEN